jgi:hypothetical protein
MVYNGHVENGMVVFDQPVTLPEGTEVRIELIVRDRNVSVDGPTLAEQFSNLIGAVPELPPDMAKQHDHYLHGAPKR